jgi:two-component system sensor histidine kinase RegB
MSIYNDSADDSQRQRMRLETLIRLRWLAVAGQSVTVIVVAFWLGFPLPLLACSVLIALLAAVNFYLTAR